MTQPLPVPHIRTKLEEGRKKLRESCFEEPASGIGHLVVKRARNLVWHVGAHVGSYQSPAHESDPIRAMRTANQTSPVTTSSTSP